MKKWHYFLVALFAVFFSSAIVIGSSVNSYVGAKRYAGAYVAYDVNSDDDSVYWEQLSNTSLADFYENTIGCNGQALHFYVDSIFHDEDDPNSDEDDYYEYILKVKVFDGTDVSVYTCDDSTEYEWYFGLADFNVNNYFFDSNFVYFLNPDGDASSVSLTDYSFTYYAGDMYYQNYFIDSTYMVAINPELDSFYVNDVLFTLEDCYFFEEYFWSDGTYFYSVGLDENDEQCIIRCSVDGSYIVIDSTSTASFEYCWSDGKYAYYDNGSTHMIFDTVTNEWVSHTWSGYTGSFNRSNVWSDGNDIYMTLSNGQTYKLHVENAYVSPYPNVLSELIALMTGGIAGFASGIGENLSVLAESIFVDATNGGLSAFGGLVVIFAGIALALGLSRWAVNFITSLGKRNR